MDMNEKRKNRIEFTDRDGSFCIDHPDDDRTLYFPIGNETGLKGAVTPYLGGDLKLDQNTFILEPTSVENLHNNRSSRNFWCIREGARPWSACGCSTDAEAAAFSEEREDCQMKAGFLWQELRRVNKAEGYAARVLSFVPYRDDVEIMHITIENLSREPLTLTCVGAVPIFGRSADNLRDHRHVTSLLHRIKTEDYGVLVKPTLSFDERGHRKNQYTYYVCGISQDGQKPAEFYPTVEGFTGARGSFLNPQALFGRGEAVEAGREIAGKEAMGGLEFPPATIEPGGEKCFTLLIGATLHEEELEKKLRSYQTAEAVEKALADTKEYWRKRVNLSFETGDDRFDGFLKWVCFQPFLRKIYGCSFLPHHDYGKGGRGWRDLWQDCLSLLIMDPGEVGQMICNNFAGVRIDGSNATIIGSKPGEFIADRNNITRVWMDHGMWPFLTTSLYIEQTGDLAILEKEATYFKDPQVRRGTARDNLWEACDGNMQKKADEGIYFGSLFEHLLIQHLTAICETGDHGNILLRGADWNDALDMATKKGESVAFTFAYAGNLRNLANYAILMRNRGITKMNFLREFGEFLADLDGRTTDVSKHSALHSFLKKVEHSVSGETMELSMSYIADLLEQQADALTAKLHRDEWIGDGQGHFWFNSYYDDHGNRVEGVKDENVRMMLTGQVFAVMSGLADRAQVKEIVRSADCYLYSPEIGGYRLNTDFHEEKYDLGRMFGFAYGEKENGAVFSHMAVMYAYALYKRGFAREGYKALQSLADAALAFETSRIYPGIPEYFNNEGRGLYHYLTGAASWYALTMVTQVFGVGGELGNLCLHPQLMPEQFDEKQSARLSFAFAHHSFEVTYQNPELAEAGNYRIEEASLDGRPLETEGDRVCIPQKELAALDEKIHHIRIRLAPA